MSKEKNIDSQGVQEYLAQNPQIKTVSFTCYPNEDTLFWRGFKSGLGACAAVFLCLSIILYGVMFL